VPTSSLPLLLLEFEDLVGGVKGEIIAQILQRLFQRSQTVAADDFVDLLDGFLDFCGQFLVHAGILSRIAARRNCDKLASAAAAACARRRSQNKNEPMGELPHLLPLLRRRAMVMRTHGGVLRTEPTETHRNGDGGALPVAVTGDEQPDFSGWEAWMAGHKELLKDELLKATGEALGIVGREFDGTIAAQAKRIEALELQLAEARGALDVLRGKGAPGSFNVLRQEMLDRVGDALGMVRADFEDKLAVQAKRISELELKLAEAVGAINILRGKGAPGSFNVKGTFDANAVYNYLDVVAFNGSSWVATRDRPGEVPGPGWQLLSSAGRRGPKGERGPVGPRGAEAPRWRSVTYDAGKNAFVVRLSDGSPGPILSVDCVFSELGVDPNDYSLRLVTIDWPEIRFSLKPLFERFFHEVTGR
jgi:uncharacterized coiled-coil protein SlyX